MATDRRRWRAGRRRRGPVPTSWLTGAALLGMVAAGPLARLAEVTLDPASGPATGRWAGPAAVALFVGVTLAAALRPVTAAAALALAGPVLSALDLLRDGSLAAWAALAVLTGVAGATTGSPAGPGGPGRSGVLDGRTRRRLRPGAAGWSAVLAVALTGAGAGLVLGQPDRGMRTAVTVALACTVFVLAVDPLRDLPRIVRLTVAGSAAGLAVTVAGVLGRSTTVTPGPGGAGRAVALAQRVLGTAPATPAATAVVVSTVAVVVAVAAAALVRTAMRHERSPGPAVICLGVALGACGGAVTLVPTVAALTVAWRYRTGGPAAVSAAG